MHRWTIHKLRALPPSVLAQIRFESLISHASTQVEISEDGVETRETLNTCDS